MRGEDTGIDDRGVAGIVKLWKTGLADPGTPRLESNEKFLDALGSGEFGGLSIGLGELGSPGLGRGALALAHCALMRAPSVSGDSLWLTLLGPGVRGTLWVYGAGGDLVGGAVRGPLPTHLGGEFTDGPFLSSGVTCQLSSLSQVA
jgi:hypothetical protein